MVRTVVLKALKETDQAAYPMECVTDGPMDLFMSLENYEELEGILPKLFDAQSVERIKEAAKAMRRR
jgi:hypothetical protein